MYATRRRTAAAPPPPVSTSSARTLGVGTNKTPRGHFIVAKRILEVWTVIELVALERAIVVAVDTALLLQRAGIATIELIRTSSAEPLSRQEYQSMDTDTPCRYNATEGFQDNGELALRARMTIRMRKTPAYAAFVEKEKEKADGDTIVPVKLSIDG